MRGKFEAPRGKPSGRHLRRKRTSVRWKPLVLVLTLVLVVGCVAGGSLAWLTDRAGPISNTFTIGNIQFGANDTPSTVSTENITYVPGQMIERDVTFTVAQGSEPSYLFIRIQEVNNTAEGLNGKVVQYDVNNGLTAVPGHDGYYYMAVGTPAEDKSISVFANNQFTVNPDLTKAIIDGTGFQSPTISATAAAVQKENIPDKNDDGNIDYLDAWELLPAEFTGSTANP